MTDPSDLVHARGSLHWLDTDAGTLIVVPRELVAEWSGIEAPQGRVISEVDAPIRMDQTGPATDYDRVCSLEDGPALLPLGRGAVLVLGGVALPTTFQRTPDGGLFAQLETTESGDYPALLPALPAELEWQAVSVFDALDGELVLMDSTDTGWEAPLYPRLPLRVAPGPHRVLHARFQHPAMELVLTRLSHNAPAT